MSAPQFVLPTTGTDPKSTTKQIFENAMNPVLQTIWDAAVVASMGEAEAIELREQLEQSLVDRALTEAARDASFFNAKSDTTISGARARVADGETFIVIASPTATEATAYRRVTSTTEVLLGSFPTLRRINRIEQQAQGVTQFNAVSITGACVLNPATGVWTIPTGGVLTFNHPLTPEQIAAGRATVYVPIITGGLTAPWVDQRIGTTGISGTQVNLVPTLLGVGLVDIALDPAATQLRLRLDNSTGSPCTLEAPDFLVGLPGTPRSDGMLLALESLRLGAQDNAENIFSISSVTWPTGTPGTVSGETITLPAGTTAEITIPVSGRVVRTESILAMFKASGIPSTWSLTPAITGAGGTGPTVSTPRSLGDGWMICRAATAGAATAGDQDPTQIRLRIANVNGTGFTAAPLVLSDFFLGKGITLPPSRVTAPGYLRKYLSDQGVVEVNVDQISGSDSGTGTRAAPFATVGAAMLRNPTRLLLRAGTHRIAAGLTFGGRNGLSIESYKQSGDTNPIATIDGSLDHAPGTFAATVADAAVLYKAMATNPLAVFETVTATGAVNRMGVPSGAGSGRQPTERLVAAANEAAVRANVGAWWWGAGSEGTGLYIRPYGGTTSGKVYKTMLSDITASFSDIGLLRMIGVGWRFGGSAVVQVQRLNLEHWGCEYAFAGTMNGLYQVNDEPTVMIGHGNRYYGNSQDGLNLNGSVKCYEYGSEMQGNFGDGCSPHSVDNEVGLFDCRLLDNAKQGFVSVGDGRFMLHNNVARNNGDRDLYIASAAWTAEIIGNVADDSYFQAPTPANGIAQISRHRGTLSLECTATIRDHKSREDSGGQAFGLRVASGTVDVRDFKYTRATNGIVLAGGTLTAREGQVLRNTTGISQTAGTLNLDANDPINVFGNTTQFSGVSAPNQAATVSVAAV